MDSIAEMIRLFIDTVRGMMNALLMNPGSLSVPDLTRFLKASLESSGFDILIALTFLVAMAVMLKLVRRPADVTLQPSCPAYAIKSLYDPVAVGSDFANDRVRWVRVNRSRLLLEHVNYFEKMETGWVLLESAVGERVFRGADYVPRIGPGTEILGGVAGLAVLGGVLLISRMVPGF